MSTTTLLLGLSTLLLGLLGGLLVGLRLRPGVTGDETAGDQALIRDSLDRLHDQMRDLESQRASWQGQLHQQVSDVRLSTDELRRETGALATALRKPQVRGQWGEMHLRRSVELAGLVDHCDFTEQVHLRGEDGVQRPDLAVRMAGGRSVIVDAKVPLDAYLDALSADEPEEEAAHRRRHALQLKRHIDSLASKSYWRSLENTPEFVVLFVPAESFLSAALDTDPDLIEHAAARDVIVASPVTLIALLRTIGHGWTAQALSERTREIHELGRDLHRRLAAMGGHFDKLGRSLNASVEAYNQAIGSLESRVLVTARQFEDISGTRDHLTGPRPITQSPRPLIAAEFTESPVESGSPARRVAP